MDILLRLSLVRIHGIRRIVLSNSMSKFTCNSHTHTHTHTHTLTCYVCVCVSSLHAHCCVFDNNCSYRQHSLFQFVVKELRIQSDGGEAGEAHKESGGVEETDGGGRGVNGDRGVDISKTPCILEREEESRIHDDNERYERYN